MSAVQGTVVARFLILWFGHLVSIVGSGLTTFALGVWVYQQTESVTSFMLVQLSAVLATITVAPFAGVALDRYGWRRTVIAADLLGAVTVLGGAFLAARSMLTFEFIYAGSAMLTMSQSLRAFACTTAIPDLVEPSQLGRANGLVQLAQGLARVVAPLLGAALLVTLQLRGVLVIDTISYSAGLLLWLLAAPSPSSTRPSSREAPILARMTEGVAFLRSRPGLMGLLAYYAAVNVAIGLITVLVTPLVLAAEGPAALGVVMSAAGFGVAAGGLLMSVSGGPRRRIHGVLATMLLAAAALIVGGFGSSVTVFAIAAFVFFMALPIMNASSQAIWQRKVPTALRGRVFAVTGTVAMSALPVGYMAAGPLADHLFEPLMAADGALAQNVGLVLGTGPGRGVALFLVVIGIAITATVAFAYASPRIRRVEEELPDMDAGPFAMKGTGSDASGLSDVTAPAGS